MTYSVVRLLGEMRIKANPTNSQCYKAHFKDTQHCKAHFANHQHSPCHDSCILRMLVYSLDCFPLLLPCFPLKREWEMKGPSPLKKGKFIELY